MDEVWRPIAGHPGYEVSSLGRVRGLSGRILKPFGKYPQVYLAGGGYRNIRQLVADAFLDAQAPGTAITNIDGDIKNNSADNLAFVPRGRKLTEKQVDDVLLLLVAGVPTDEVAERYGYTNAKALRRFLHSVVPESLPSVWSAQQRREHGTRPRYGRGCRCSACRESVATAWRESQKHPVGPRRGSRKAKTRAEITWIDTRRAKAAADTLLDSATRRYQQWTGPELEAALQVNDSGRWLRSNTEVAALIGRTIHGVNAVRRKARSGDLRALRPAGLA